MESQPNYLEAPQKPHSQARLDARVEVGSRIAAAAENAEAPNEGESVPNPTRGGAFEGLVISREERRALAIAEGPGPVGRR